MTYPAKARYDHFNKLLFNGALPDIPVVFKRIKHYAGQALAKGLRDPVDKKRITVKPGSMAIHLDSTWKRTDEQLDALLIHEMIHIHFFSIGRNENHGVDFLRMAQALEKRVGFTIPLDERLTKAELAEDGDDVVVGVFVVKYTPTSAAYALLTEKALRQRLPEMAALYPSKPVLAAIVKNRHWTARALGRKVQSRAADLAFYRMDNEDMVELRKDGIFLLDTFVSSKVAAALRSVAAHLLRDQ